MDENLQEQIMQNARATPARSSTDWGLGRLEQLMQLFNGVTWDGNLIDKTSRTALVKEGLATKQDGYNLITKKGVRYLYRLGVVHP